MRSLRLVLFCAATVVLAVAAALGERGLRAYGRTFAAPGSLIPSADLFVVAQVGPSTARPYLPLSQELFEAVSGTVSHRAALTRMVPFESTVFVRDQRLLAPAMLVDASFFDVTHLPVLRGRGLTDGDFANQSCVIKQTLELRISADVATAVGSTVSTQHGTCVVVGVVAADALSYWAPQAEIILPISPRHTPDSRIAGRTASSIVTVIGSRRAGEMAELRALVSQASASPGAAKVVIASPAHYLFSPPMLAAARAAMVAAAIGAVVGVLAVIGVLLLDVFIAARHFQIEIAIGASPVRYARQAVRREFAGLWLPGCGAAAALGILAVAAARTSAHVGFTTMLTRIGLCAALCAGTSVVIRAAALSRAMRSAGCRSPRIPKQLVRAVVALQGGSVALLVCTGAYIAAYRSLTTTPLGVDLDGTQVMELESGVLVHPARMRDLLNKIGTAGPQRVLSFSLSHPLRDRGLTETLSIEGGAQFLNGRRRDGRRDVTPGKKTVGPDFARMVGARIVSGRDIAWEDTVAGRRVAVVNQRMASTYWPDESPLGKRIKFVPRSDNSEPWAEIVGIVSDIQHEGFRSAVKPEAYVSILQENTVASVLYVLTNGPDAAVAATVAQADAAPFRLARSGTLRAEAAKAVSTLRDTTSALAAAAVLACSAQFMSVALAAWAALRERRRDLALRLALGARPMQSAWPACKPLMKRSLLAIACGIPFGIATIKWLSRFDPDVGSAGLGIGVAATASMLSLALAFFAAHRSATRLSPAGVLRE